VIGLFRLAENSYQVEFYSGLRFRLIASLPIERFSNLNLGLLPLLVYPIEWEAGGNRVSQEPLLHGRCIATLVRGVDNICFDPIVQKVQNPSLQCGFTVR
jgi:hypothetical protein